LAWSIFVYLFSTDRLIVLSAQREICIVFELGPPLKHAKVMSVLAVASTLEIAS
jgi:hypothetical protein